MNTTKWEEIERQSQVGIPLTFLENDSAHVLTLFIFMLDPETKKRG